MQHEKIRTVGIVGLGRMGLPVARHLLAAGFEVRASDPHPQAQAAARSLGATLVPSCRELAESSDAVIVLVGTQSQVEQAVFGADGLADGMRAGNILAVASTVAPAYMVSLAQRIDPLGICVVDTPVARGETAAETGRLLVYAGGPADILDRLDRVLACIAEHVCRLGPVGAGQAAKAINNMLLWTCLTASVEGLDLGEALGVDREALRTALRYGSGANWAMESRADERPALWAEKDMAIVLQEAERLGFDAPISIAANAAIKAFKIRRGLPPAPPDDPDVPA